jgi:hypothetical protein
MKVVKQRCIVYKKINRVISCLFLSMSSCGGYVIYISKDWLLSGGFANNQ